MLMRGLLDDGAGALQDGGSRIGTISGSSIAQHQVLLSERSPLGLNLMA
jgi:hypothetical protein